MLADDRSPGSRLQLWRSEDADRDCVQRCALLNPSVQSLAQDGPWSG